MGFFVQKKFPFFCYRPPYQFFISLGRNCEPALRFKEFFGNVDSTLFTFAAFMEPLKLPDILNNLDALKEERFIPLDGVNMFKCEKSRVAFHGRRPYDELKTKEEIAAEQAECQSRVYYLIDKTKRILNAPQKKVFVLTVWEGTNEAHAMVLQTADVLRKKTQNYDLVVVLAKKESHQNWYEMKSYPELHIRFLNSFSPFDKVSNPAFSDQKGWRRIWAEFSLK